MVSACDTSNSQARCERVQYLMDFFSFVNAVLSLYFPLITPVTSQQHTIHRTDNAKAMQHEYHQTSSISSQQHIAISPYFNPSPYP